jgi:iron complex outermembrane receptor protein
MKAYSGWVFAGYVATTTALYPGLSRGQVTQTANSAQSSSDSLQEIVVTAEKRSVDSQKAPAAITSVSGQDLADRGIQSIDQAQVIAPSVKLGEEGNSIQAFIRGVGVALDAVNIEPQVAIMANGVYLPREATGGTNLFDIDHIEVLPGPQGTLYGRSATGGVINSTFNRPGSEFGGYILAEGGNFGYAHVTGAVDLPASDVAKFRVAVNYNKEDGYYSSGSGALNDIGVRGSALITPIDDLSVYLWGSYVQHRGSTVNGVNVPYLYPGHPYNDLQPAYLQPFGQISAGPEHQDVYMAGSQIDYSTSAFTISYIPAFVRADTDNLVFLAGLPNAYKYDVKSESNELRITGNTASPFQYLGGLYQFSQTYRDYVFHFPFGNVYDIPYSKENGVAAYAQGTYSVTDAIRLILGGRYSATKRDADFDEYISPIFSLPHTFSANYDHFDWKVGTEYDVAPHSMLYAIVQTGFNPGTYNTNPSIPGLQASLQSTKLLSYTAGIKNRFFDDKVQVNAEFFDYEYKDLLVSAFNVLTGQQETYNAQKVKMYGAQLDTQFAVTHLTRLYASAGYLHARNVDFIVPQVGAPALDYDGLTPIYSPTVTLNLGGSQTIPLRGDDKLVGRVDSHHETEAWNDFGHAPGTNMPAYWQTDLSLTYEPSQYRYTVAAWVRNAENYARPIIGAVGGIPGPAAYDLARPRTFGLRVDYKFGKQ